jgi:DMSO/TMAO reductase YedYZ molybdopterin-dependent catalytic subunit
VFQCLSVTSIQEEDERKRVPPGQIVTQGWPVLHAGSVPDISIENWRLHVYGEVRNELDLSYEELLRLDHTVQTNDIHCVTSWSKLGMTWEGVKFKDLMRLAQPTENAHYAIFEAEQGFTTNLPLEIVMDEDVLIAFKAAGKPLELEHGGPVRMLIPKKYFYKSAKWLRGIKLTEQDEPGFWEIRGYSNSADPWKQERYAGLSYAEIMKNRIKAYARKK